MQVINKIKLIDKICTKHPSYGVDKGWSEYVGGMKDTGQWFFRKMFRIPEEELQSFLDDIIAEENKPRRQANLSLFISMEEAKANEKFYADVEANLPNFWEDLQERLKPCTHETTTQSLVKKTS